MNFNLNIHRVKGIRLSEVRVSTVNGGRHASRDLIIETSDGDFELNLFSEHVDEDNDQELLEVKV